MSPAEQSNHKRRRAFFPVSLNLDGRLCVVIGAADDREAIEKSAALEEAGAHVRRIYDPRKLRDDEVTDAFFVISTPQDEALSARLRLLADAHRFLLCCIDQPKYGFVAMAAIAKAGPVRVAVSTAGLAPRVAKALKNGLQKAMDEKFTRFVAILARRREETRARHPEAESASIRRRAMIEAARAFRADVRFEYPEWFESGDAER
jgi:precorrin-2 dehydrogenase / sirohydrochlorin ferrochelatase